MKRLIIFVLATVFALSVSACKNSNERSITATEFDILVNKIEDIEYELKNLKDSGIYDKSGEGVGAGGGGDVESGGSDGGDGDGDVSVGGGGDDGAGGGDEVGADDSVQNVMPYEHAYVQKSIYLTSLMINTVKDGDFMQLMTVDPSMENYIEQYGAINDSMLKRAIVLYFNSTALDKVLVNATEGEYKPNANLAKRMRGRILQILANMLNAENGSLSVAFFSTIQQGDAFIKPANLLTEGNILVILLYDSGSPDTDNTANTAISFVSFRDSMEGTIIGSAGFVDDPDGELSRILYGDEKSIFTILDKFEELNISRNGIDCSIYEGEQLTSIPAYAQ